MWQELDGGVATAKNYSNTPGDILQKLNKPIVLKVFDFQLLPHLSLNHLGGLLN